MTPYYEDSWLTVYGGDCREVMRSMEPESVHCVVTSPPYWGLRDYGTASWDGGDPDHEHRGNVARTAPPGTPKQASKRGSTDVFSGDCDCGARRIDNQLGLEATPEEYVANMVAVFREVRRVLRNDGTVWLNLGDSYAGGGTSPQGLSGQMANRAVAASRAQRRRNGLTGGTRTVDVSLGGASAPGLKPKDLVGIPWRVAFALQEDGWYLRSDIIWSKPNPMPESVTDRPTKSHEYLFLLSKSPRYYFDADAVREASVTTEPGLSGGAYSPPGQAPSSNARCVCSLSQFGETCDKCGHPNHGQSLCRAPKLRPSKVRGDFAGKTEAMPGRNAFRAVTTARNLRSVWTIATQPYPGAHFATFPRKLVEPCIKAGTSEKGVCPECGAPWVRVVQRERKPTELRNAEKAHGGIGNNLGGQAHQDWANAHPPQTTGWRPDCAHYVSDGVRELSSDLLVSEVEPATVLDPFAGSGTTGAVAQALGRRAVLIDLNPDYLAQAMGRNRDIPLGLEVA